MPCHVFTVVPRLGAWFVESNGPERGPYCSNDMAARVATIDALHMRRRGQRSMVSVRDGSGEVCLEYRLDLNIA
jgi:hypothetical protein